MPDSSSMPDAIERTAAAGQLQYAPRTTTSGFDWSDFGIGAGAGLVSCSCSGDRSGSRRAVARDE